MNDDVKRRSEMLTRVGGFGGTYASQFPPTSRGGELFAIVKAAIAEIDSHLMAQNSSARAVQQQTTMKSGARAALLEEMQIINQTARVMALSVPGLEDKFRLPYNSSDQLLLVTARVFAQDALPLKDEFIKRELPATFIDDLNELIADFSDSIGERNQSTGARVSATAAIDDAMERAMRAMRELEIIVKNKFRGNRAVLAEWASARHIERRIHRSKAEPPAPTAPPSGASEPPAGNS